LSEEVKMDEAAKSDREVRAARNQSLYRAVNEKIREINTRFGDVASRFAITCECPDTTCAELLHISPGEYEQMRSDARRFVVLPGHVYPEVERVVAERDGYTVVEKLGSGGEYAEASDPRRSGSAGPPDQQPPG
jgi:hypothetical protein